MDEDSKRTRKVSSPKIPDIDDSEQTIPGNMSLGDAYGRDFDRLEDRLRLTLTTVYSSYGLSENEADLILRQRDPALLRQLNKDIVDYFVNKEDKIIYMPSEIQKTFIDHSQERPMFKMLDYNPETGRIEPVVYDSLKKTFESKTVTQKDLDRVPMKIDDYVNVQDQADILRRNSESYLSLQQKMDNESTRRVFSTEHLTFNAPRKEVPSIKDIRVMKSETSAELTADVPVNQEAIDDKLKDVELNAKEETVPITEEKLGWKERWKDASNRIYSSKVYVGTTTRLKTGYAATSAWVRGVPAWFKKKEVVKEEVQVTPLEERTGRRGSYVKQGIIAGTLALATLGMVYLVSTLPDEPRKSASQALVTSNVRKQDIPLTPPSPQKPVLPSSRVQDYGTRIPPTARSSIPQPSTGTNAPSQPVGTSAMPSKPLGASVNPRIVQLGDYRINPERLQHVTESRQFNRAAARGFHALALYVLRNSSEDALPGRLKIADLERSGYLEALARSFGLDRRAEDDAWEKANIDNPNAQNNGINDKFRIAHRENGRENLQRMARGEQSIVKYISDANPGNQDIILASDPQDGLLASKTPTGSLDNLTYALSANDDARQPSLGSYDAPKTIETETIETGGVPVYRSQRDQRLARSAVVRKMLKEGSLVEKVYASGRNKYNHDGMQELMRATGTSYKTAQRLVRDYAPKGYGKAYTARA